MLTGITLSHTMPEPKPILWVYGVVHPSVATKKSTWGTSCRLKLFQNDSTWAGLPLKEQKGREKQRYTGEICQISCNSVLFNTSGKASNNTVPILGLAQEVFRSQDFSNAHRHHLSLSRFCGCTEWFTQAWPQRNLLEVHHADSNCSKTTALEPDCLSGNKKVVKIREKPYHKGTGPNSCCCSLCRFHQSPKTCRIWALVFGAVQKRSYTEPW